MGHGWQLKSEHVSFLCKLSNQHVPWSRGNNTPCAMAPWRHKHATTLRSVKGKAHTRDACQGISRPVGQGLLKGSSACFWGNGCVCVAFHHRSLPAHDQELDERMTRCARWDASRSSAVSVCVASEHVGKHRCAGRDQTKLATSGDAPPDALVSAGISSSRQQSTRNLIARRLDPKLLAEEYCSST